MNPKTRKIILSSVPYLFVALFATKAAAMLYIRRSGFHSCGS